MDLHGADLANSNSARNPDSGLVKVLDGFLPEFGMLVSDFFVLVLLELPDLLNGELAGSIAACTKPMGSKI